MEVTEELKDEAFELLMAPEPTAPTTLLANPNRRQLPPVIEERLADQRSLVLVAKPDWATVVETLEKAGGFTGVEPAAVTQMLFQIPRRKRGQLAGQLKAMIDTAEVQLDAYGYDALLGGFADIGDHDAVLGIF